MVKSYDSNIAQNIVSKVFLILGGIFTATALVLYETMNWVPKASFALFIVAITFLSVGVPFLLVGLAFYIYVSKKEKKKERLITDGRRVLGKVIDFKVNYQVSLNRRHPVKLVCETDEYAFEEKKRYISENYWGDPEAAINKDVTIYIDREKNDQYYVDLRSATVYKD